MNAPDTQLPEWLLSTPEKESDESLRNKARMKLTPLEQKALVDLERQTFEIAFETILERMSEGTPFDVICREYHTPIKPSKMRTWIFRNERRRQAYLTAKALCAEAVEDELIRISDGVRADGSASMDEVARSQLRINTRKWLLQVWNRRRYGDVKHIEQVTTTKVDASTLSTEEIRAKLMESLGMSSLLEGSLVEEDDDEMLPP